MLRMQAKAESKAGRRWALPGLVAATLLAFAGCGGGGGGDEPPPATPVLAFVAGNMDGRGIADGTGTSARFNYPTGVARDASGNVYIADSWSHTIRKMTPAGVVTTFAGTAGTYGSNDGTGTAARFYYPADVAVDTTGQVYVADWGNATIRKITPAGEVTTLAGQAGVYDHADGTGSAARFRAPEGIATDGSGNVYVADALDYTVRRITPAGVVTTVAGTPGVAGDADGPVATASFRYPTSLAVDAGGNVYVGEGWYQASVVRLITTAGVVSTYAGVRGSGFPVDGPAATASFSGINDLALDGAGNLYVADSVTVRKISAARDVTTLAGLGGRQGSVDGTGSAARFMIAASLTSDAAGNLVVADQVGHTVRAVTPGGTVTTVAGAPEQTGSTDGPGAVARFGWPSGLAADSSGALYVADADNAVVRKVTPSGLVSTFAGTAHALGWSDATGSAARFTAPYGVATDSGGNVYVADTGNQVIRKINGGAQVTTLAGSPGVAGSADGTGAAATFNVPRAIATDAAGNAYVADASAGTIRKITPAGVVTTLAGSAGQIGYADGTGAAARFYQPSGLAVDAAGNVYVADSFNQVLRKITPTGVVTTLAGTAHEFGLVDGRGAAARFQQPHAVAITPDGTLYVADISANTIRKVTPDGMVTTVIGRANAPGFQPGPLPGLIATPRALAVVGETLYVVTSQGIASVTPLP